MKSATILTAAGEPGSRSASRHGPRPVVERIAGWSARHRLLALGAWLLLVAGTFVLGIHLGTKNVPSYDPGQAGRAERVLNRPDVIQRPAESVLIQARASGRSVAADPEIGQAARQVAAALARLQGAAAGIRAPQPGGQGLISADGRSELVTFSVPGPAARVSQDLHAVAAVQAAHPDLVVAEAGDASVSRATTAIVSSDFRKAEVTSLPLTLILLALVFGALIAAGVPLLLAGTSVITAISLLSVVSRWLPVGSTTSSVVLLVGMAVGVDYSLFYLRRLREERQAGHGMAEAVRAAAATSGRAIVVSGLTVMISMAGLFLTGIGVFAGLAAGTIIVVGVAVIGSVTVLPALLAWLGPWVDRARVPFLGRRRTAAGRSRLWESLVRRVVARPLVWGGAAAVALALLSVPAAGMRLSSPGLHSLPASVPVVRNLLAIQDAFPGGPAPAEIVVTGHGLQRPQVAAAVAALRRRATAGGPVRRPVTAAYLAHGQVLEISAPLAGDGVGATSSRALSTLRNQILPATLGRVPGVSYQVAGLTASDHDFAAQLDSRLPWVFAFVLGLAFVLLLISFRSLAIPLVSIGLNLLSVGAAYGLLTLIFQDGLLHRLLGFSPYGAIVPWMPLFLFVLLFGLSMDYHVFILTRIREHRAIGPSSREAVIGGIGGSAGVVTSAAVIMVAVFSIFATLSTIEFKMFGVAMAAAVLIDATIVRGVLMPAALALLGERSWVLPRWLTLLR